MALIVEDGSVVAGANAFVSVSDADSYHALRGNSDWTNADDDAKAAAIVKATFYLDRLRWKGIKTGQANPLAWPRYGDDVAGWNLMVLPASPYMGVIDEDGYDVGTATVPDKVKQACSELALRYVQGADPEPDLERGGQIVEQKVDVITTRYAPGAPVVPVYTIVQRLLRGLLRSSSGVTLKLG